ncbi:hypothetical protein ACQKIY_25615 [Bacillus mycoides]|uniref:hypothetical protein n=1 Tax=Bacillus mycoides TaxID=1405 RepID=UPI003D00E577
MKLKLRKKKEDNIVAKKGDVLVYGMYHYLIVSGSDNNYTLLNLNCNNIMSQIHAPTIPFLTTKAQEILGRLTFVELIPEEELEMRRLQS